MKHLIEPDREVLRAFVRLEDNLDFQSFLQYLFDQSRPVVLNKLAQQRDVVAIHQMQGACQVIDDLREITAKAVGLLGKKLIHDQQKEENANV